jgi:hypothetical protein
MGVILEVGVGARPHRRTSASWRNDSDPIARDGQDSATVHRNNRAGAARPGARACDNQAMDVVFVHGAGGGAWEWDLWRRVFAAEIARLAPEPSRHVDRQRVVDHGSCAELWLR